MQFEIYDGGVTVDDVRGRYPAMARLVPGVERTLSRAYAESENVRFGWYRGEVFYDDGLESGEAGYFVEDAEWIEDGELGTEQANRPEIDDAMVERARAAYDANMDAPCRVYHLRAALEAALDG